MDRLTCADDIRRLLASPDVVVGSVARSPKPAPSWSPRPAEANYPPTPAAQPARSGSSGRRRVPDLSTALRRVEDHALPLESARAQAAYVRPSAINRLLILDAEPHPGRGTVLLLREAIGF
jgi:hypothetical protein